MPMSCPAQRTARLFKVCSIRLPNRACLPAELLAPKRCLMVSAKCLKDYMLATVMCRSRPCTTMLDAQLVLGCCVTSLLPSTCLQPTHDVICACQVQQPAHHGRAAHGRAILLTQRRLSGFLRTALPARLKKKSFKLAPRAQQQQQQGYQSTALQTQRAMKCSRNIG